MVGVREEWFRPHSHQVHQNLEGSSGSVSTKSAFEQPKYLHCTGSRQTYNFTKNRGGGEPQKCAVDAHVHTQKRFQRTEICKKDIFVLQDSVVKILLILVN